MIDQKKLSLFWDKNVPDKFKHFSGSEYDDKIKKCQSDIREYLISQIDFGNIRISLDWGCGGGIGSVLLSEHSDVIVLDIADSSLKKCEEYMNEHGKRMLTAVYKLDDIKTLVINETIDLLFSASVVQHFPSYEYWKRVTAYWRSLQPKWIAIQTRHGDQNKSNEEVYYNDTRNYILSLYLTTEEVIDSFNDIYELKYHKLIDDNYSMYEYFVFKIKEGTGSKRASKVL